MPYNGITASIKVGGVKVAYISNFSIEESCDMIEITTLGSKYKGIVPTIHSWSASADGTADFESESAQSTIRNAMIEGTQVSVQFYLSPTTFFTGTALIESFSLDISAEDKGNISISLSGIGKLTMTPA